MTPGKSTPRKVTRLNTETFYGTGGRGFPLIVDVAAVPWASTYKSPRDMEWVLGEELWLYLTRVRCIPADLVALLSYVVVRNACACPGEYPFLWFNFMTHKRWHPLRSMYMQRQIPLPRFQGRRIAYVQHLKFRMGQSARQTRIYKFDLCGCCGVTEIRHFYSIHPCRTCRGENIAVCGFCAHEYGEDTCCVYCKALIRHPGTGESLAQSGTAP